MGTVSNDLLHSIGLAFQSYPLQLLPVQTEICNKALSSNEFQAANWNLYSFAVEPEFHGGGVGRQLLRIGEDEVLS